MSMFLRFLSLLTLLLGLALFTGVRAQEAVLSFDRALELALQSPGVELAEGQLELARRRLAVARSPVRAELSGGYSRTWGELSAPESPEPQSLDEGGFDPIALSATLNVVPYGPSFDQAERERFGVLRAESALRVARAEAVATVTEQYLEALRAGEAAALAHMARVSARDRLAATRAQAEAGAAIEAQVLQAEIAVSQADNELAEAERTQQQAFSALALTLGVVVTGVAEAPDLAGTDFEADPEARLEARDDVLNAVLAVREAELAAAATLRDTLPSGALSLGYAAGTDASNWRLGTSFDTRSFQPGLSASFDPDSGALGVPEGGSSSSFSLSLGLTVPLDPSLGAALAAAELSVQQARAQAERTRELARLEIASARAALEAARRGLELAERLAAQSAQAAADARRRFELGLISPIALQEAQIAAAEAALARSRAADALLLARLALARALAQDPLEIF